LAFPDQGLRSDAKIGILAGSLLAGLIGYAILRRGPAPVHEKL
jgi:Na+/H+ antiporter NhaA